MHAREGGKEEGKGRVPPLRCKHGTLPDVRILAYAHISLTTPSSTCAVAPPPPSHTILDFDVCCMQCGACCAAAGARMSLKGARILHASMRGNATTPAPSCPLPRPFLLPKGHSGQNFHRSPHAGHGMVCQPGPDACQQAHRSASRDHWPNAQKLLCSTIIAL